MFGTFRTVPKRDTALFRNRRTPISLPRDLISCDIWSRKKVLSEIFHFHIESCIDLGAGLGTGNGAAQTIFPSLHQGTCVEADPAFIRLGKNILLNEPVE